MNLSARQAIRGGSTSRNRKRKKYAIGSTEVAAIVSICVAAHHNACVVLSAERPGSAAGSAAGAGEPLKGLTPIELSMFNEGLNRALQLEAVCDGCSDLTLGSFTDPAKGNLVTQTNSSGLGVRFNGDQCTACHNQPVAGELLFRP